MMKTTLSHAEDPRTYYTTSGPMSDPKNYAPLFEALPDDVAALCEIVQGLLFHIFWADKYGITLSETRKDEVQLRLVSQKLARMQELDAHPFTHTRELEQRLVSNCRDFALFLCSILRQQGVPARARCGFSTYFLPDKYVDHWVCEYWNAAQQRWVLVDAQLDALQCATLKIDFDPLDVPRERFLVAGKAWQLCRSGEADAADFGIFDMHGIWFVRGDLIRDFLALNKVEILPWDGGWGFLADEDPAHMEAQLMDRVAALTLAADESFDAIQALYAQENRFHVPQDYV